MNQFSDQKVHRESAPVLRCAAVRCQCDWAEASLDLVMRRGEFHFAPIRADAPAELLTRAMLGLGPIQSGEIFFRRWQWHQLSFADQYAARFQMARIVDSPAWVQNLQVQENILWPMLHQGIQHRDARRRLDESLQTMNDLNQGRSWSALMLRLKRSLTMRPAFVSETVLRVAQWVRCLAFRPDCVLAVRPLRDIPSEVAGGFARCVQQSIANGTAWLWLDADNHLISSELECVVVHPSPFGTDAEPKAT